MQLTEHFSLSEFINSSTARSRKIDNSLYPQDPEHSKIIANLKVLCENVLEPLRQHLGVPVIISSGYRCPPLNKAVGGVRNSQHMTGEAADIYLPSLEEGREMMRFIMENCTFDQLLWEKESKSSNNIWIHISCKLDSNQNRHQVKSITKHA